MAARAAEREATAKRSMKCTRDIRLFPPSDYRLPDDGRQWLHVCERRKTLFLLLSSYANGDGSHINVAIGTLAEAQGWSYRTVCRLLDDFRALGILNDGDLDPRYKNTRVRSIDMEALRRLHESAQIDPSGVPSSPSGVTSSISGVPSSQNYPPKMAHNRLQTEDLTENPTVNSKQGLTDVRCAIGNPSDEARTDNYLQDEVRAPRSSDFGWSEEMAERIKQDLRSEPSFDKIWRGNGEWSTAGYEEPGKRDWGDLRMLGGLMVGSELERWETLFEILKDTQLQYDVEDSGRLFSIATQTVRGAA
jgi:hypothetical protein